MQKSSYFPSPLRKDYISKPLRNFNPVIVKEPIKSPPLAQQPLKEKTIKYLDGLLVNMVGKESAESGLFFTKNYSCIIYSFAEGQPHGQNYVVYLSGIVMAVNYAHGIVDRWLVALLEGKFAMAYHFKKGKREGPQYFYDWESRLLVVSEYKAGSLFKIKHSEVGDLQKMIQDKQVRRIVDNLRYKQLQLDPKFPTLKLDNLSYFGGLNDRKDSPDGYGVLFGAQQMFIGNFNNGILNGIGGIRFQNGNYYYGQLNYGVCDGYGSFHSGKTTEYKFGDKQIQNIEFQKYLQIEHYPENQQNWLSKFKDLQRFDDMFRNMIGQCQMQEERESGAQQIDASQLNLQIDDSTQKKQDLVVPSPYNEKEGSKRHQNVPKLSLFEKMRIKEKEKLVEDRSARVKQLSNRNEQTERYRTQTQRNEKNNVEPPSTTKVRQNIQHQPGKFKVQAFSSNGAEMMEVQEVARDKWLVPDEHNFMRPNRLQAKPKIDRSPPAKWTKNQSAPHLDLGKLIRASSDVSEGHQDRFIKIIGSHQ